MAPAFEGVAEGRLQSGCATRWGLTNVCSSEHQESGGQLADPPSDTSRRPCGNRPATADRDASGQ